MDKEKCLPISWAGWDQGGEWGETQFYDVEWNEDFGPFKKGEKVDNLFVSQLQGVIRQYDDKGNVVRECNIVYKPV